MKQYRHKQRLNRTSLCPQVCAAALVLGVFGACAGPIRSGDVDWSTFEETVQAGLDADDDYFAQIGVGEGEIKEAASRVEDDERRMMEFPDSGEGLVDERFRLMQAVQARLDAEREDELMKRRQVRELKTARAESMAASNVAIQAFLSQAWSTTREGSLNLHVNLSLGASTDSRLDLTGTITHPDLSTEPFSGFLTDDGVTMDSSEIGVEYYVKDNLAVEAGAIFGKAVRNDESIDFATLSYNDESYAGLYFGLKYCLAPVRSEATRLASGRLRPFVNMRLGLMGSYDVSGSVSIPAADPLQVDMSGDSYMTLGFGGGLMYAWTEHITFELGLSYIRSLSGIEGDWSFTGSGAGGDDYRGDFSTDLSTSRAYVGLLYGF
jgi:hypothetical protein